MHFSGRANTNQQFTVDNCLVGEYDKNKNESSLYTENIVRKAVFGE